MPSTTSKQEPQSLDYYQLLGLTPTATPEQIRKAYKSLARKTHPDRCGGSHEAFLQIKRAYDTLIDAERREIYDLGLRQGISPAEFKQVLDAYLRKIVMTALAKLDTRGGYGNIAKAFQQEIKAEQRTVKDNRQVHLDKLIMVERQLSTIKKGKDTRLVSLVLLKKAEIEVTLRAMEINEAVLEYITQDVNKIEVEEQQQQYQISGSTMRDQDILDAFSRLTGFRKWPG